MIHLPDYLKIEPERVVYRAHQRGVKDFFSGIQLSTADQKRLREEIQSIVITHRIDQEYSNIMPGKRVEAIYVFRVQLNGKELDNNLIDRLDSKLGMHALYIIVDCSGYEIVKINFKEPAEGASHWRIVRGFELSSDITFVPSGRNLDDVYDKLFRDISGNMLASDTQEDLATSVNKIEEMEKMERDIAKIRKKHFAAKSPRQRSELWKELKRLEMEVTLLKQGNIA